MKADAIHAVGAQKKLIFLVGFLVAFVFGLYMHLWLASWFWTPFAFMMGFIAVVVPHALWTRLREAPAPATTNPTNGYRTSGSHRPCPFCGEQILSVAVKCRHCGEFLDEKQAKADHKARATDNGRVGDGIQLRLSKQHAVLVCLILFSLLAVFICLFIMLATLSPQPTVEEKVQRIRQTMSDSLFKP